MSPLYEKQLDWKSFAIGILLTTTVVFGVAATNPTFGKQWDEDQKWLIKKVEGDWSANFDEITKTQRRSGWLGICWDAKKKHNEFYFIYRRPVDNWPALPPYEALPARYTRKELNYIYP